MICDGVPKIVIDIYAIPRTTTPQAAIQEYFTDYTHYLYDGVYKLCFDIQNGPATFKMPFIIHSLDRPLVVSGLKAARFNDSSVPRDFDIVTLEGTSNPITFIDSDIQGGIADEAACLVLRGTGITVKSTNETTPMKIHGCKVGIKIEGNDMHIGASSETTFPVEKVEIYNNQTGIHWVSGTENKFSFVKIFDEPDYVYTMPPVPDKAIAIDSTDVMRPEFNFKDTQAESDGKALFCTRDSTGRITNHHLELDPAVALVGQKIVIFKTETTHRQIADYFTNCIVEEGGICRFTSLPYSYSFSANECAVIPEVSIVALIDGIDYTSRLTSLTPFLNGPPPPTLIGAGGTSVDLPSVPEGERDDTGNNATGDGAGSGENLEVQMAPAMGMKTGCGGMIVPPSGENTFASSLILWWLIFMAPAVLVVVRIKKRK